MATALSTDNRFLSGLFTVINNSNPDEYNRADLEFINGLERIFNMCIDRNGAWHGDDGKFISKNNLATSTEKEYQKKLTKEQIEEINQYVAPNGLDKKNNAEFENAYLTVCSLGLSSSEIAKCFDYSEPSVKIHLSDIRKKYGFTNKTDAVVQSAISGLVDLDNIDLFKTTRDEYNKKEIDKLAEKLNLYKQGMADSPLTTAETKCLQWASLGLNNKEIAELYRFDENSKKTTESNIKKTLESIYFKLYAKERNNAVAIGLKYGIIKPHNISKYKILYKIALLTGKI